MYLTLSISGYGHHAASWRLSSLAAQAQPLPRYDALTLQAQAGLLDGIFFVPPPGAGSLSPGATDTLQPDAMPLIGSLVAHTSHIGLGASVYMAHTEPFHTARAFAVLDNLSAGRTAWLVDLEGAAQHEANFGHATQAPSADAHYERAEEYITVAMKLWDSWEDGAVVADKPAGMFADQDKIHPIHHTGTHFTVRGPLTAVRPIQGHPVIVMDDMSQSGRRLAAGFADVFLGRCETLEEATGLVQDLRRQTEASGRSPQALRILMTICPILAESDAAAQTREALLDSLTEDTAAMTAPRFVGTAEGFCDFMAAWCQAGACDGFNIVPPVLPDDVDILVGAVIPLLQERGLFRTSYDGSTMREHLGLARPLSRFSQRIA
jgi:alkanesulfonate monooxygenase SsuD/methylene tetrahydromethanopterin reductase-like flavin-dependent oxidoreductase (luciferase family)